MTDIELQALSALVWHETVQMQQDLAKYGEAQFDPVSPAIKALSAELERRGIIK